MAVPLVADALAPYARFSLYNSPYPAHDRGCAVDLYPDAGARTASPDRASASDHAASSGRASASDHAASSGRASACAPSPVAGEVLDTRTTRAPPKPYAAEHDHLVLVDAGEYVARLLHVEPAVEAGDRVAVGDPLGRLVRSGYFAPWVDDHLHLEFREPDADLYRASGSLPVAPAVEVTGVRWDGTGTVVETDETYAVLDAPAHPAPGERYAAVAAADGTPLDGGLVHYAGGGALADARPGETAWSDADARPDEDVRSLSLLGQRVGTARGRTVEWADVAVRANGERLTGLSLFCSRTSLGAKLVAPDHDLSVGDRVEVAVEPTDDPVRLG